MISKARLKHYGYTTIDEYHDYIVESVINGNRKQAKDLIRQFNKEQRLTFAKWLINAQVPECNEILLLIVEG